MNFDWSDLAFGSKKPINNLKAIFISAPRELSSKRFAQLVKAYLPKGNLVIGLPKEPYVIGFEGQPQFKMLHANDILPIIQKVNNASSKFKIYTLAYFQRELPHLLEKLSFSRAVFVNGSWKYSFHTLPQYYTLSRRQMPYELISPFTDEAEAQAYASNINLPSMPAGGTYSDQEMLDIANRAANQSFDYSFQTGVSLGRKEGKNYRLVATAFNKVVPYQSYAMHFGNSREQNFSPPHDLNHYDTIHAEVALLINALERKLDLAGHTVFINLLPCPACAKMLSQTDIADLVYTEDHSDGYAIKLLEATGKKVRRLV